MQIQLNTDSHISGREKLSRWIETVMVDALDRFSDQITRLEVHLSDVNSHKPGHDDKPDKRCLLEARLAGRQPVAVSHQAPTLEQAVDGAAGKLKRSLDSTLGRLSNRKGRPPLPEESDPLNEGQN
jgi:ribosome-associated translation inhibitor RaiA